MLITLSPDEFQPRKRPGRPDIVLFYVRPSDFWSLLKIRLVMGAIIMTSIQLLVKVDPHGN